MKINKTLKQYFPIADLIAKTFGKNCEVVIHDLTKPQNSIIYIVNSHVTGKKTGETFNVLIKQVLLSKSFNNDVTANYKTTTIDGREMKSSTAFIRNSKGDVIGALCINYDIEKMKDMKDFLDDFMQIKEDIIEEETEVIENVIEIADGIIDKIIGNINPCNLKREKKIELIEFMDAKGIFLIKGAIEKVAEKLNISKITVYSYLDQIKKSNL